MLKRLVPALTSKTQCIGLEINPSMEFLKEILLLCKKYEPAQIDANSAQCTEVRNGQFSSGGGMLSQLQWYHSDIQKIWIPKI